jgi:hypothetical protein
MTDAGRRHTKSARIWDGTWEDLTRLGREENFAPSTLAGDTADLLAGYHRCARCGGTPVPVTFGDLSGRPLREWVAEAEKAVRYQKCRDHQHVLVGAGTPPAATTEPPAPPSARAAELVSLAAGNGHDVTTASELPPPDPTLAFQAPGTAKVVTASVPEARRSARQGLAGDRCEGGGPHPVNRRIGDTCGKCGRQVGGSR